MLHWNLVEATNGDIASRKVLLMFSERRGTAHHFCWIQIRVHIRECYTLRMLTVTRSTIYRQRKGTRDVHVEKE